ncbi:S-adenosyl-L-methionine-dependentmethyltransferases superfamily protein [Striga asiatica]|uniref:S-adenosyl-L-methionine-dependentmethyltransferases superfamily protein n=1 Tax=Striga asiatica TaxID=4170 RepID=A0A5A7NZV7_STRAF|nr:S-adenosyl-L-methionine-dependentmethyltransferases superfamily protein [Striga asiatica]
MSIKPKPTSTKAIEKSFVAVLSGVISPYPIVHIVTMQKYRASTTGWVSFPLKFSLLNEYMSTPRLKYRIKSKTPCLTIDGLPNCGGLGGGNCWSISLMLTMAGAVLDLRRLVLAAEWLGWTNRGLSLARISGEGMGVWSWDDESTSELKMGLSFSGGRRSGGGGGGGWVFQGMCERSGSFSMWELVGKGAAEGEDSPEYSEILFVLCLCGGVFVKARKALILRGCHPLPRRRCFSRTLPAAAASLPTDPFSPLPENLIPDSNLDMQAEKTKFLTYRTELDLPLPQLFQLADTAGTAIRLAVDVGGGAATFAAQMKLLRNVTVLTTTMNLGTPYSSVAAHRGLVPLHAPLQQRLPVFDGVVDLVRCGHAVNRWIPVAAMEFMFFDVDRVLRKGGYFFLDRFSSKKSDLDGVFGPLIGKLRYRVVKWAVANKMGSGSGRVKDGEVYLTALLQKP